MIVTCLITICLFLWYNEMCNKNEGVQVKKMEKILIVEDDRELNQAIGYALEKDGYQSVSAFSVGTAMKAYMEGQIDLVLLDVNLPDGEGFTFCKWVKERKDIEAGMKYIVFTTKHHDGFAMFQSRASSFNIVDYTPFRRDIVDEVVQACRRHGMKIGFY